MAPKTLPSAYQSFIHVSRYARWLEAEQRRETWPETVTRYLRFMKTHLKKQLGYELSDTLYAELESAILNLEVLPSMRALMTAGPALDRDNLAGFNCAFLPVDSPRAFDEALYVLTRGTGVGFSVERKFVDKLPIINEHFEHSSTVIVVDDTASGWAKALRELLALLYAGQIPSWDTTKVRKAGARLMTFGGRASGPEPLEDLFRFAVALFTKAAGRRLTSLECHDLMCFIAKVIVVGGVRRSALISLSDLDDERMRTAKSGAWYNTDPQRALSNNSIAYTKKPDTHSFLKEWMALYESKSGERGIYNRQATFKAASRSGRRIIGYAEQNGEEVPVYTYDGPKAGVTYIAFGCNP